MSSIKTSSYKPSLTLFELKSEFNNIIKLYESSRSPKVLLLSGEKGSGKFTLINHFLVSFYDKEKYNFDDFTINQESSFYKKFLDNIFPNIIYIKGSNFKNTKVEEIRNLKSTILKTSISKKERFIIFDDVELLNSNSLNALLKIIEEPTSKNNFILLNNKKKKLIETIKSRALEFKIILPNYRRVKIIESLIKQNSIDIVKIDFKLSHISPGNFLRFNNICVLNKIDINGEYLDNISTLLMIYKKEKNSDIIDFILYLTEMYFYNLTKKKSGNFEKVFEKKSFIIKNIDKFLLYNLNQNSLINAINNKLSNG